MSGSHRDTFDCYDQEFNQIIEQTQESLNSSSTTASYTGNLLQQCDDLVKQMALEARSCPPDQKRELMQQVRKCKSKYQSVQQEYERQGLMSGGLGDYRDGDDADARRMLQDNEDRLEGQNDTLERARRTMEETEAVAMEITTELGENREKLMSAHGRVRQMGGLTGRARGILTSMGQRALQQKLILYSVAIGLCGAFVVLLLSFWRG